MFITILHVVESYRQPIRRGVVLVMTLITAASMLLSGCNGQVPLDVPVPPAPTSDPTISHVMPADCVPISFPGARKVVGGIEYVWNDNSMELEFGAIPYGICVSPGTMQQYLDATAEFAKPRNPITWAMHGTTVNNCGGWTDENLSNSGRQIFHASTIGLAIRYVPEISKLDMNDLEQRQRAYKLLEDAYARLVGHEMKGHLEHVQNKWPPPGLAAEATAVSREYGKQLPSPFKVLDPDPKIIAQSYPEAVKKDGTIDFNILWRLALADDQERCAPTP